MRMIVTELTDEEALLFDDIMGHMDPGPDDHDQVVFNSMLKKLKFQKKPFSYRNEVIKFGI